VPLRIPEKKKRDKRWRKRGCIA